MLLCVRHALIGLVAVLAMGLPNPADAMRRDAAFNYPQFIPSFERHFVGKNLSRKNRL
jgi:hypothetical protein